MVVNMNNMREVLSVGCSHTSCITSLSFHGGWEKNILLQRMICLWASNGTCQLSTVTNVNAVFFYHVVISCMQHVQLILINLGSLKL